VIAAVEAEVAVEVDAVGEEVAEADAAVAAEEIEAAAVVGVAALAKEANSAESDSGEAEDDPGRVVRKLAIGQEVVGVVKRTADFGAFVDIGVGRDGLIHISELSVRRVAKVTDVVQQGQEVTGWIKKLDRERNRISLTLIPPGTKTVRDLSKDDLVTGTVTRIVPYGAFLDIGIGREALLHVREMGEGYVAKPEDVVSVGEELEARIVEISRRRGRIDLSIKGLRPEPEAEAEIEAEAEAGAEEEALDDRFADVEVLSPMELAFQKAMGKSEDEDESVARRRSKRARRKQVREIQDEIVSRTLDSGTG